MVGNFKDERIRYIKYDTNKGASAARNIGIKAARGKYIAFQDSDDAWMPEKLEKQVKAFTTVPPEVGIVYTGFYKIQNNKQTYIPSPKITPKEGDIFSSLLKGNFISPGTVLVRRECFGTAGMWDESLPNLEDWEWFMRVSRYYRFKYIDEPLLIAYHSQDSNSANISTLVKSAELILAKNFKDFIKDKKLLANYHSYIGKGLCSLGEMSQGRRYFVKAFKINPLNFKYPSAILASLLGQGTYNTVNSSYSKTRDLLSK
jgi:glycosyltransferase involved in cell wall biosynthesis